MRVQAFGSELAVPPSTRAVGPDRTPIILNQEVIVGSVNGAYYVDGLIMAI
jgi:hypothetical protein